jgi:hypothetical protein
LSYAHSSRDNFRSWVNLPGIYKEVIGVKY